MPKQCPVASGFYRSASCNICIVDIDFSLIHRLLTYTPTAMTTRKIVQIDSKIQKSTLTAAQKKFNSLTKKIDRLKKQLIDWEETIPLYREKVSQECLPLEKRLQERQMAWVVLLDSYYDNKLFKKNDKAKLKHLICIVAGRLINDGYSDEALKPLFNRYSDDDYDSLNEEAQEVAGQLMKEMAKKMFDIDLGDDLNISSPEQFHAHLEEKMREQAERLAAEPVKERKKTKKELEKEARLQEEEALASKSVQDIYRKLVATLHPDREPDLQERERKTVLMQRVNIAYDKKDLLKLLELQLEIEQIDPLHLNGIADSRLKHFNKILNEQSLELADNIGQIEDMFKMQINMPYYQSLSPKGLMLDLANSIREMQADIASIDYDLQNFQEPKNVKAWLKDYKIPKHDIFDEMDDLLGFY